MPETSRPVRPNALPVAPPPPQDARSTAARTARARMSFLRGNPGRRVAPGTESRYGCPGRPPVTRVALEARKRDVLRLPETHVAPALPRQEREERARHVELVLHVGRTPRLPPQPSAPVAVEVAADGSG